MDLLGLAAGTATAIRPPREGRPWCSDGSSAAAGTTSPSSSTGPTSSATSSTWTSPTSATPASRWAGSRWRGSTSEAHGFAVRVTSGDVDVALAVDATELVTDGTVDTLAIASRDMDFKPALETAARHGVRTVVLAPGEHGRSEALPAVADEAVLLD